MQLFWWIGWLKFNCYVKQEQIISIWDYLYIFIIYYLYMNRESMIDNMDSVRQFFFLDWTNLDALSSGFSYCSIQRDKKTMAYGSSLVFNSYCKLCVIVTQPCPIIYVLSVAAVGLQNRNGKLWKSLWPQRLKIFTLLCFRKIVLTYSDLLRSLGNYFITVPF